MILRLAQLEPARVLHATHVAAEYGMAHDIRVLGFPSVWF